VRIREAEAARADTEAAHERLAAQVRRLESQKGELQTENRRLAEAAADKADVITLRGEIERMRETWNLNEQEHLQLIAENRALETELRARETDREIYEPVLRDIQQFENVTAEYNRLLHIFETTSKDIEIIDVEGVRTRKELANKLDRLKRQYDGLRDSLVRAGQEWAGRQYMLREECLKETQEDLNYALERVGALVDDVKRLVAVNRTLKEKLARFGDADVDCPDRIALEQRITELQREIAVAEKALHRYERRLSRKPMDPSVAARIHELGKEALRKQKFHLYTRDGKPTLAEGGEPT
jgi:hypothetical protein